MLSSLGYWLVGFWQGLTEPKVSAVEELVEQERQRIRECTHRGCPVKGQPGQVRAYAPHCGQRILHAPSECEYCDHYPDWQQLRRLWGIAFSGHVPQGQEQPCPADAAVLSGHRGDYNAEGGNAPHRAGDC